MSTRRGRLASRRAARLSAFERQVEGIHVDFREPGKLHRATVHVGPTNSGKTHDAIRDLVTAGQGVYAAPLRQLAREVYESLSELAPGRVGLVTGEQQIDPHAPIICATAQAAPMSGRRLVLDEAHWIDDHKNGHAWTRLLTCGRFDSMSIVTSEHAREAIIGLVPDAKSLEVVEHRRLSSIAYGGSVALEEIASSTAVVAFSRQSVLHLASRLRAAGREPAVMYGALPNATRQAQLQKFASSRDPVLVTTDVIGHGVNLPIANVAFAEIHKFDGKDTRALLLWEAAQIAGRAGRFGHSDAGGVYQLAELAGSGPPSLDLRLVVEVTAGVRTPPSITTMPVLAPRLQELGCSHAGLLAEPSLRRAWSKAVELQRAERQVRGGMSRTVVEHIDQLTADRVLSRLSADHPWRLANTPVRHPGVWSEAVRALAATSSNTTRLLDTQPALAAHLTPRLDRLLSEAANHTGSDLLAMESAAMLAKDLAVFATTFPDVTPFAAGDALAVEHLLAMRINEALNYRR